MAGLVCTFKARSQSCRICVSFIEIERFNEIRLSASIGEQHRLILLACLRAQGGCSSIASLTRVYVKNPKPHSADHFEDRAIRILEADHADHWRRQSVMIFLRWRDKLNLLCLQICVGPVDIVDTEGDAADRRCC